MRRIREKEYKKAIQKAKSQKQNVLLANYCTRYLNSGYEDAFDYVERMVIGPKTKEKQEKTIPTGLEKVYLEIAKHYSRNDEFDKAINILAEIGANGTRDIAIRKQVELEARLIIIKRGLQQGRIDQNAIEEVRKIIKNDDNHEIETDRQGEFSDYDFVKSFFGTKIPVKDIGMEIFPENMSKPTGRPTTHRSRRKEDEKERRTYNEKLSVTNRLNFIMENFNVSCAYRGDGKLLGSILFEMTDSDLVIIEKFYTKTGEQIVEDYGNATYIMPRDQAFDLVAMQQEGKFIPKKELRASKDTRLQFVEHKGDYYKYLVEKYKTALSAEGKSVKIKNNPFDEKRAEQEERGTIDKKGEEEMKLTIGRDNNSVKMGEKSNEIFLAELNEKLGGLIPEKLIQAMQKEANYSFEKTYTRLHKSIIESLRLTEVPEEKLEEEALKVFAYMRVTKQLAAISNGVIKKQEVPMIVEDSVLEYQEGMEYMLQHGNDEGISWRKMAKQIKSHFKELQEKRMQGVKQEPIVEGEMQENDVEQRNLSGEETQPKSEPGQEEQAIEEDPLVINMRRFIAQKQDVQRRESERQEIEDEWSKSNEMVLQLQKNFETARGRIADISPTDMQNIENIYAELIKISSQLNEWSKTRNAQAERLEHARKELEAAQEEKMRLSQDIIEQMQK